jgi:hypothetical protein
MLVQPLTFSHLKSLVNRSNLFETETQLQILKTVHSYEALALKDTEDTKHMTAMHGITYCYKLVFYCIELTICLAKTFHKTGVQNAGLTCLGKIMVLLGPLECPSCPAFSPQVSTAR